MTNRSGIGLVEFITILAVLGLLAVVGLPALGVGAQQPEPQHDFVLVGRLMELRLAIDTYWAEHDGFPGTRGALELERQLTFRTDAAGEVGDGERFTLGPYLGDTRLPDNPFVGSNSVRIESPLPGAPVGDEAWIYDPLTGQIRANVHGDAPDGTRLFDL